MTVYRDTVPQESFTSTRITEEAYPASPGYPASDNETVLGTVLLPKIYGKGLSALEIASSGSIILSVNDFETMDISSDGTKNTFQAKRGLELDFQPHDSNVTVHVGDHTWSSESFGDSNYQVMRTSNVDGYMLSNSLLVTSDATFRGDAYFEGDTFGVVSEGIDLTGSTYIDGTLQVTSNVTFDSNLYVVGDVNIEGNINVTGVFNTTSVTQLHAEDKIIQLSTHSNLDSQNENSVSDGAGVLIQGVLAPNIPMSGFDGRYDTLELLNSSNNKIIDKSLTWNNNGGVEKMGMLLYDPTTDAPNLEPYWEMRGGGLRITQQVYNDAADAFVDVSFALRINAREELEILKCVASNNTFDCRRVARFGAQGHLGRGAAKSRNAPRSFYTAGSKPRVGELFDGRYYMYGRYTYDINEPMSWVEGDQFTIGVNSSDPTTYNKWVLNGYEITENYEDVSGVNKTIVENNFAAAYGTDTKRIVDLSCTTTGAYNWMIIEKYNGLFYTIGESPVTQLITVKTLETKLLRLDDALNHIRSHPTVYVDDILDGTEPIVKIACGVDFVLVVLCNGELWGYGNQSYGRMATTGTTRTTSLEDNQFYKCTAYNDVIDNGWRAVDVSCFNEAAMVHFRKHGSEDRIFFHGHDTGNYIFKRYIMGFYSTSTFMDPSDNLVKEDAQVWVQRAWDGTFTTSSYIPSDVNNTNLPFESKKLIEILSTAVTINGVTDYPVCEEIGTSSFNWRLKINGKYYGGGFKGGTGTTHLYGFSEYERLNTIRINDWTDVVELDVLNLKITQLKGLDPPHDIQVTRMLKNITNVSFYDLTTGTFYIIDNMTTDAGSVGYTLIQDTAELTYATNGLERIKMADFDPNIATSAILTVEGTDYGTHEFVERPSMSLAHINDDSDASTIGEEGFFRNIDGTWDGRPGGTVRFVEYVPGYGCAFWITDNTNY